MIQRTRQVYFRVLFVIFCLYVTQEPRKELGDALTLTLCELLPAVEMLPVEIREIEQQVYSNKQVVMTFLDVK